MDSDAQFQRFTGSVANVEGADFREEVQRQRRDLGRVLVSVADRQAAGHHVRIADGLDFVRVVALQNGVEQSVQFVEQIYHLEFCIKQQQSS